jgi:hypothetical protein
VFAEFLGIEIREFNTIPKVLNLGVQTTDILVGDIGHFFQHNLLYLRFGEFLQHIVRPRLEQQVVPNI